MRRMRSSRCIGLAGLEEGFVLLELVDALGREAPLFRSADIELLTSIVRDGGELGMSIAALGVT